MYLSGCVAAQRALHGEEPAFGAHVRGKRGREIAEQVADTMRRCGTTRRPDTLCPGGTGAAGIGSCWGRCDGGVGYDGAARGGARAGGADVGQAPETTPAFTREDEQDGAGATSVARMPPASAFMALAGTQMRGQYIAPRVVGQVRQDRGPGRRRCPAPTDSPDAPQPRAMRTRTRIAPRPWPTPWPASSPARPPAGADLDPRSATNTPVKHLTRADGQSRGAWELAPRRILTSMTTGPFP